MGMKRLLQEQNTQLKVTHVNPEPFLNFREREKERGESEEGREGWRKGEREREHPNSVGCSPKERG